MPRHIKREGVLVALGGGEGNVTVPNDAPIQPPQAFVNTVSVDFLTDLYNGSLNANGKGIISIDTSESGFLWNAAMISAINTTVPAIDLSNNAISDTNAVLAMLVSQGLTNGILDLSGGTNAAPTGQGLTDKAMLISNGWTVTTN